MMLSFYLFYFALLLLCGLVCFHLHCSAKTSCRLRRLLKYNAVCHSANSDKTKIRLPYFIFICLFKINQPPEKNVWVFFCVVVVFPLLTNNEKQLDQNQFGVCGIFHVPLFLAGTKTRASERDLLFTPKTKKTQTQPFFFLFVIKRNKKRHQD